MMAARPFKSLFQGAGRNALDLPVAGLAALAAGFAAFAVPQDLLSRAVVATGLPSLISAAQPPLGLTARVVLAVGGAAIVFGLVFLLLRLLDRSGLNAASDTAADETQQSPRVRRRDGHPDAPAPRPISAARDLGEPMPPRAPRAATPLWLDEAEPVAAPVAEAAPEPEVAAEPEPVAEPVVETWQAPEAVVVPGPEPIVVPEPEPLVLVAPEPAPVTVSEPEAVAEVEAQPEPVAEAVPLPEPEPEIVAEADLPEPEPEPAPRVEMPSSIAELMARLEQGLARRRMIDPVAEPAAPAPAPALRAEPPQVFPEAQEAPDDRLQSAIASLQRLAARSS